MGPAYFAARELARRLNVSRTTVTVAYDRLTGEGFITSRVGAPPCAFAPFTSPLRHDALQGALAPPAHRRVALDVVPDGPHRLLEGPGPAAFPLQVVAVQVVVKHLPGASLEQMPGTHQIQRR